MSQVTRPVRSGSGPDRGAPAPSRARRRLSPGRVVAFLLATAWLVVVISKEDTGLVRFALRPMS